MSKPKKNKKIFAIVLIALFCISVFMLVKEKYIADTTRRIFLDKGQKAAKSECKNTFSNGGDQYVKITYESDDDLEEGDPVIYMYCEYSTANAKKVGKNSIKFNLIPTNAKIAGNATTYTCTAGKKDKLKVTILDDYNWNVKYELKDEIKIGNEICLTPGTGGNLVAPGSAGKEAIATGEEVSQEIKEKDKVINKEANAHQSKDGNTVEQSVSSELNPDLNADLAAAESAADDDDEVVESEDGAYADGLNDTGENEDDDEEDEEGYNYESQTTTGEAKTKNVQVNKKPFKNSSVKDVNKKYTFSSFQEEMGWKKDTKNYFISASKMREIAPRNNIGGSHDVYKDDSTQPSSVKHRENHFIGGSSIDNQTWGKANNDKTYLLKCNYDLSNNELNTILEKNRQQARTKNGKITDYYYDKSNVEFFYGIQTATHKYTGEDGLVYVYHNKTKKNINAKSKSDPITIYCKKACQEIVKVEYGPPVYVNAGLCFEYRAKVTSIVRCKSSIDKDHPLPKPDKKPICIPTPVCFVGNTNVRRAHPRQGGPNEDFETCIKSCDGGKYTRACSEKCYKDVYKDPTTALQDLANNNINYSDTKATSMKSGCSTPGRYYRRGSGISYCKSSVQNGGCQSGDGPVDDAGYWYQHYHYHVYHYTSTYASSGSGIIKNCSSGGLCSDRCYWSGCSKDSYLGFNYSSAYKGRKCDRGSNNFGKINYTDMNGKSKVAVICNAADLRAVDSIINKVARKEAKKKCEVETKCTTSTAEYQIGFKYTTGEKTTKIKTPYTSSGEGTFDKLPSSPSGKQSRHKDDDVTSLLSYGGCYHSGKKKRWYQTEWTFPATFYDNKTGERIYYNPNDAQHFTTAKGLVCLPRTINDTNTAWGLKFYNVVYGKTDTVTTEKTDSTLTKLYKDWICTFKENGTTDKDSSTYYEKTGKSSDGYNIKAVAKDFGYFQWDFNIYCFYSLINDVTKYTLDQRTNHKKASECFKGKGTTTEVKTDVFTASDPLLEGSKRIQLRGGSSLPFNWSENAKITPLKSSSGLILGGYDINPIDLKEKIKADGDAIFKDGGKGADFEFYLTADDIGSIQKYNKNHNGLEFEFDSKSFDSVNGVVVIEVLS